MIDDQLRRWRDAGFFDPEAGDAEETRELLAYYDSIGLDPDDYAGIELVDLLSAVSLRALQPGRRSNAAQLRSELGLTTGTFERLCFGSTLRLASTPQAEGRSITPARISSSLNSSARCTSPYALCS